MLLREVVEDRRPWQIRALIHRVCENNFQSLTLSEEHVTRKRGLEDFTFHLDGSSCWLVYVLREDRPSAICRVTWWLRKASDDINEQPLTKEPMIAHESTSI